MNRDCLLNNVYPELVNASCNRALFDAVPYDYEHGLEEMRDIVAVPRMILSKTSKGTEKLYISNNMIDYLGIDREELFDAAFNNLFGFEYMLRNIQELIDSLAGDMDIDMPPEVSSGVAGRLFALTGPDTLCGANRILIPEARREIAERLGDFYIIPSSKHETLVVSCDEIDGSTLLSMVREINKSCIQEDDLLSNEVYICYEDNLDRIITFDE